MSIFCENTDIFQKFFTSIGLSSATSEGWRVQKESVFPGQKPETL
jgi:hypothetical protein